ncbi:MULTISPECIES: S8 family peptidase [Streptomyces]|uniref:S8 family peptidase n=1 Tax=Streptomyces malaysiensis TaxID=92644 RepID=A0ABX6WCL4_STRMQ|nr:MULTISPECIES: S8 family peptidase [Streptomyces]ATL86192.1 putative secreted subtilisin-like serine protease [Streptomyces malaysiensis]AUA10541.1 Extracellular serine proteinase precursor [Streptomyces sp. M56]MCM3807079.1 S8 family peptidase [Streptomyces sp. DR7-3]MCQ6247233.1 S8 family peptidase [Streptomyces malaysiensis]MYX57452.1 S8 family serine peptidase [Streptomyces sp. SID8382]
MAVHKQRNARRLGLAVAAATAVTAGVFVAVPAGAATTAPAEGTVYGTQAENAVDGSYIVMLKGGKSVKAASEGKDLAEQYGGKLRRTYDSAINGFSASGLTDTEAKRLAADPSVAKVVQNHRYTIKGTQENPPSWGLDRIDQEDTEGDKAYNYPDSAGEGVTAYVIDTGVRTSHKDFEDRATSGFDAVDNDDDADDGNGHGTHVAGTIAGAEHGVAKKAKIVAVRVLDDQGSGTTEQVVAGIDWVTENHEGPSVANMSLGGTPDEALDAAVQKAIDSGVTFGVAAGNESADASGSSPARVEDAITVASSTDQDEQSDFSNYGSVVDIYAPGSDITSDWNTGDDATNTISGTSMATPHVVGAAAVYLSGHQDAKPADVSKALTDGATADKISNPGEDTPNKLLKVVE